MAGQIYELCSQTVVLILGLENQESYIWLEVVIAA